MAFISSDLADGRLHRELRDQVISTVVGPISESRRRLYISRRRAKWRKILNEASLVEALGAYGFEVVECEKLTFDEQVRTFSHAEVIVGAHGAGLANMMFSPPGAKVLEIAHPQWPNPDYFVLAANLGLDYCIEMGRPAGIAAPAYDHIEVDLTSLCKTLDNFF
jgi:capsular polysaccharide biosynthesis protein